MGYLSEKVHIIIFCTITILYFTQVSSNQHHQKQPQQQELPMNWPITLNFHETKTNAMLGEILLRRVYARIGYTDNIIRAEVDTLFENLKEVIEKRLRKCERKRRKAGNLRNSPYDAMYGHMNATLANQYSPRDHGNNRRTRTSY